ncbi:AfsR/SARP family transcriptional regulator [Nocardia sp. CS682]|uniref:AfsR/SARP family transcriptional regulator n=1 Tax=Nocardia sp. CS682 TaxID=1047172 RepID=UPI001431DFF0|nr:AfsR/SARP family transcriptional regulator [Nocardia sp. CS682]
MLQFVVLGEVRAWRGVASLPLGPPQRRAVLAALLLRAGSAVTAAELVEGIWGERPVPRAIAALRTHVAQLRRTLEPERTARGPSTVLVTIGDGYALRVPPEATDVGEVERLVAAAGQLRDHDPAAARANLVAALGKWHGPALSGLPGPFAERQRSRLEQWRLAILEDRLALDIETGHSAVAVADLGSLIEEHPLRERFRALLMTALYHSGRQSDALDAYAQARRALVDGVGVEPGPELTVLHERILRGTMPELRSTAQPRAMTEPHALPVPHTASEPRAIPEPRVMTQPHATSEPSTATGPHAISEPHSATEPYAPPAPHATTGSRAMSESRALPASDAASESRAIRALRAATEPHPTTEGRAIAAPHAMAGPHATAEPRATTERGPEPVPAQLPPDIADFTGRARLVDELAAQLTGAGSAVAISAVGGMGGVGKTTLALHVAHRVRVRFPDGQLYANLHGVDPVPTPPGAVLGGFLRALGVAEGDIPSTVDDRAAELRTRLSGKRILMVLDNVRDYAQVAPLLAGSAVLITSRSALTELPAVTRTRLDVLETAEAMDLLVRILGTDRVAAEEESAREVVAHCGLLPLAVRIVGARLAVRPQWTIASFADRLADEKSRLSVLKTGELAVEAAFRLGYGQLNAEQARTFRTLALAEVPDLSIGAIAAVLGISELDAEDVCESLVDLSLLETTAPGRYRFHDLLRLFARGVADEDESAVLVRVLDYHLASAKNLLSAIDYSNTTRLLVATEVPGRAFASGSDGQAWNDIERPVVIALHQQAARVGGRALDVAADLAWVMAELMDAGTGARELSRALESLLEAAIAADNPAAERRIRTALGALLQVGLGEVEASLPHLRAVSGPPATDVDRRLSVLASVLLGIAARRLGDADASHRHFEHATQLTRALGDRSMEAWCLALVTRTYCEAGQYDQAVAMAERAIALARESSNPVALGWATHELAATLSMRGEHPRAIELGTEAVRAARRNGVRLWEGWARTRLAQIHLQAGNVTEAETQAAGALQLLTKAADPIDRARAMALHAAALAARGHRDRAERELREAAEIFTRAGLAPPTIDRLYGAAGAE